MKEHRVASVGEVPDGAAIAVDVGERRIAIFRYRDELFALDETCPHRGGPLHQGSVSAGVVMCPWHQWRFDLETGCSPVNPQSKVNRYSIRVVDDAIWITV